MPSFAILPLVLTVLVALALAQSTPLAERHRHWLEEEAHFLLSQRERASFLELASDEARDRFVLTFWDRRDPTPGSSRNEFRERHDARLDEADRLFTFLETRRGRFTERGHAYQLLGPPQSREDFSHTADRLFPLELWHYVGRTEAFLPESFYLIYFREGGQGDYRLWSPVTDGIASLVPDREPGRFLLDEQGAYDRLLRVDIELAQAARSLVPGDPDDTSPFSGASVLVNTRGYADMADRYRGLDARVRAGTSFRQLGVASTGAVLYDRTGVPQVHYALEVPSSNVTWREEGARFRASFGIACRMMDERGQQVDAIEDWLDLDLSAEERSSLEGQAFSFQGRLILPTGRYVLDFTLVSMPAGTRDQTSITVDVPGLSVESGGSSRVSPILLARSREPWESGEFVDRLPFQAGGFILSPSPGAVFSATKALAYLQLSGISEGTTVDWSLTRLENDKVVWRERTDVGAGSAGPTGVVGLEQTVPLETLPDGDYALRVALLGETRESRLTVDRAATSPSVRVLSRDSPVAGDGRIRLQRGLLFARIGDEENAIRELRAASQLRPRDLEIHLRLALLLYAEERYAEAVVSLQPIAPHYSSEPDVFVLLGLAWLELGDAAKAVSHLEAAFALRPHDPGIALALDRARQQSGVGPQ
jgi:GWxTD domain-containing protein